MTKRIGILTSGGDCAGLNAAIRAVALRAHHGYGWTTVGLRYGTLGLLERPVEAVELDPDAARCGAGAPGRHLPRQHQPRRSLRLSRCPTAARRIARAR